jgi:multiple sugar transport system ATP-binding protein
MRGQLAALHARLATTTIYVTHDQVEAMTLGHRVAVMRDGRILQVDSPQALYAGPVNLFVAAFIGSPAMNLVEADVGEDSISFGGFRIPAQPPVGAGRVIVGIRPEAFEDAALGDSTLPTLDVHVQVVEDLGPDAHVIFAVDAPPIDVSEVREAAGDEQTLIASAEALFTARVDPQTSARVGRRLRLTVDPGAFHYFDPATGLRLERACAPALARV